MQTLQLVRALVSGGYQVTTLCCFEYDTTIVNQFISAGSQIVLLKRERGSSLINFVLHLRKEIKKCVPDIVHVQYMAPGALPILAARLAGQKRVLATVHQPYTPSHGKFSKIMLCLSAMLCKAFVVISKNAEHSWFGSSSLFDEYKTLEQQPQHFTIYNAVDIERIQELAKNVVVENEKFVQKIEPKALVFGAVSRLREEKGIDLLIQAFSELVNEGHNVYLHIVGTGPDEEKLKNKVFQFEIEDKVSFFGEASWEIAMQQMAVMDVVVVPSRFEGFGLTAAEAMAMGKPVVASNVFGLKEVVSDGQTGLLFENGNKQDLFLKLNRFCMDSTLNNFYSENSLKKVNKFGLAVYKKKIIALHKFI